MKGSSTEHKFFCKKWLQNLLAFLFWLLVWQGLYLLVNKEFLLVSPLQAVRRLGQLMGQAAFWSSVLATCLRVVAGFLFALLSGIALAFLSARFSLVKALLAPLLGVVRATPVASFIILALIWISTERLPVFIAFLMVLPMTYSNLSAGLEHLDRDLLEMARLFRFSKGRTLRLIYLPHLMPYVTAASTAGLGFAWKSTIAAEVIVHPPFSIGKQIWGAKIYLEIADLFAWTIGVILLSIFIERGAVRGLKFLEQKLLHLGLSRREAPAPKQQTKPTAEPVKLEHLSKGYGSLTVLEDFSLTLPSQGVVALMGQSGCGKTTLLRLLAGLEQPDQGSIQLGGRKISMVFQEDRLLPGLTAKANILAVLPAGEESSALADRMLEACGLSAAAHKLPEELSGGMRRRVAIARAIAYGGDILLLDEPFKGLDEQTKLEIEAFVAAHRPPLTLQVTHDREEARRLADTLLQLEGPPLRVLEVR
jgi:NitT/TauT family transport system permease protein